MENQQSWLYRELFTGWKTFELQYISVLLLLQIIAYAIAPDTLIGMLSGLAGVICLVYGMKGRKINFIFGFIQCIAMTYIAYISQAYGAALMGVIYVISQPIGWIMWGKDEAIRSLTTRQRSAVFMGAFIAWLAGWAVLYQMEGQLPYFDSINLVISLIAQTLYICKFKENWSLWIVVNIANLLYWVILTVQFITGGTDVGSLGANLSQVALQSALLFNSIYASKMWAQQAK